MNTWPVIHNFAIKGCKWQRQTERLDSLFYMNEIYIVYSVYIQCIYKHIGVSQSMMYAHLCYKIKHNNDIL